MVFSSNLRKYFPGKFPVILGRDPPGARKIQEVKKTFKSTADHLPMGWTCRDCTRRRLRWDFWTHGVLRKTKSHGFVVVFLPSIKNHRIWRYLLDTHTPKLQVFAYYISSVGRFSVKPIPAPPVRACVECTDVAVASKQQRAHAKLNFAGENRQTCGALNVFSKIQVDSDND